MTQPTLFNLDDLDSHSAPTRRSDPDTSREAAASLTNLRQRQMAVLALLRVGGPRTLEELVYAYRKSAHVKQSDSGIRTRCSELVTAGLVEDSGARRRTKSGRKAIVWQVISAKPAAKLVVS